MSIAILPVTGIPLPFVSAGGSSLLANMAGIGLLLSIYMRRHTLTFK
jgi:rod shape determining protein RodA